MGYEKFDVEDFLQDDFFIDWINMPSPEHDAFWHNWLIQHPQAKLPMEQARAVIETYYLKSMPTQLSNEERSEMAERISLLIYNENRKRHVIIHKVHWPQIAAAIAIIVALATWFYTPKSNLIAQSNSSSRKAVRFTTYKNVNHHSVLLRLDEGSLVILKPGSSLRYPKAFEGKERTVFLQGEGFFEVRKNPKMPFLIYTGNLVTKVLGTSFTLKAPSQNQPFRIVVNTGRVLVYERQHVGNLAEFAVVLLPHQQASIDQKHSKIIKDTVSTKLVLAAETALTEFTFNNTPVIEVIKKLESAYHLNIQYNERELLSLTFTGSISTLPLDEKIKFLCKAIDAKCDFTGEDIKIQTIK